MGIIDVILWLLVLNLFGILSLPIAYRTFPSLPDRGITMALPLGFLLVGCGVWFIGLTQTIPNSWWSVILSLIMVSGVAALCVRNTLDEVRDHFIRHIKLLVFSEIIFSTAFLLVVLMRAALPDIGHTEQPMDFMLLNAVTVSPHYPPNDPWLAGFSVSYYYLGYVLISSVSLLSGVSFSVAYNLGLASIAALAAIAVFGTTFNIARLSTASEGRAIIVGFLAIFLLLVASNLEGALELARAGGIGGAGFWHGISVEGLTVPIAPSSGWIPDDSSWWWWRASRVIHGTINEFPMFSFLLGDLHPHVIAVPFLIVSICVSLQLYLQPGILRLRSLGTNLPIVLIAVIVVGALSAINLWDLPLGILLVCGGLFLGAARNDRATKMRLGRVGIASCSLCVGVFVLYSQFYLSFDAPTGGILPVRAIKSELIHLVLIWGVPGVIAITTLGILLRHSIDVGGRRGMRLGTGLLIGFAPIILWMQPVWGIVFYVAVIGFFILSQIGYRLPRVDEMPFAIGSGMTRIVGTLLIIVLLLWDGIAHGERGVANQMSAIDRLVIVIPMGVIVSLAIYAAWSIADRHDASVSQGTLGLNHSSNQDRISSSDGEVPTLGLIAIACYLIMGAELFYISDFFGGDLRRMNTVFKLYYEAWVLLSVVGAMGIWFVFKTFDHRKFFGRFMITVMSATLVLFVGLLSYYPLAGITTRVSNSHNDGLTLDGLSYMHKDATAEHAAILWIREWTARESIVIESAVVPCVSSSVGCSDFTNVGRVAASTGRPTILGWEQHEHQWRGKPALLRERRLDVQNFYQTTIMSLADELVRKYGIEYILVGPRERLSYGLNGMKKFGDLGEVVFSTGGQHSDVTIYRVINDTKTGA